mgnify:FL=1
MDDLISRQAAIEALKRAEALTRAFGYHNVIDTIRELPTAEKKGKWVLTDYPDEQTYKCSVCNEIWTFIVGTPVDNGAFFCPNCGARMEE